ncbi:MAG: 6-phosphogluconolactonase [Nitrospirota bacterium]|nr:6-phosphogluconolactonase [Nitrospirota bacterium]
MAVVHDICVVEHDEKLASEVADFFIRSAGEAKNRPFRVALSGGSTPSKLYCLLASPDRANRVKWPRVQFYFGDERCVPPDHAESNFKLANDTLFQPLGIEATQIFRIEAEAGRPDQAARRYEETIRQQFETPSPEWPRFDLILLGLGDDGHTASLFPGSPALDEKIRAVVASESPRGVTHRITFTAPLINHARSIVFMVAGLQKAPAIRTVLEDDTVNAHQYPAKLIQPVEGQLIWHFDRAAASALTATTQS